MKLKIFLSSLFFILSSDIFCAELSSPPCIYQDSACNAINGNQLDSLQKNLSELINLEKADGKITFCAADEKTKKCTSEGVGAALFAGIFSGRFALKNATFSKKSLDGAQLFDLRVTHWAIPLICETSELKVTKKESVLSITSSTFYCNWVAVGNGVTNFNFQIKSINPILKEIYAEYQLSWFGTGLASGSGFSIIKFSDEYEKNFASLTDFQKSQTAIVAEIKEERIDDVASIKNESIKENIVNKDKDKEMELQSLENQRLKMLAEEATKKQLEAEEKLRIVQLQTSSSNLSINNSQSIAPILANRRALVIGNDSYRFVAKLENAREDAKTIASNLTSLGYQVTLKLDLTEKEMKAALRAFASQVQGGDEVMFFYAGHGVQLGSTNYLLPTDIVGDSEVQVRDESIQLQRVLDDMSEKKAKFTLAMIDACRDNPFKTSGRTIGGRGLAPTTAATGQMVIFSAGTGQQALDKLNSADKNKNGLFTRVFVQEMHKPNQTIDRVVKNVRNKVAELARSVGHDQVPAIYDQVLGDFFFKK